jgi:deoxycytidylate deaminase
VIHAEANALRLARYADTKGASLAVTHFPCADCVRLASAYGVATIFWRHPADWATYPREPIDEVARTCRVKLIEIIGESRG